MDCEPGPLKRLCVTNDLSSDNILSLILISFSYKHFYLLYGQKKGILLLFFFIKY